MLRVTDDISKIYDLPQGGTIYLAIGSILGTLLAR